MLDVVFEPIGAVLIADGANVVRQAVEIALVDNDVVEHTRKEGRRVELQRIAGAQVVARADKCSEQENQLHFALNISG